MLFGPQETVERSLRFTLVGIPWLFFSFFNFTIGSKVAHKQNHSLPDTPKRVSAGGGIPSPSRSRCVLDSVSVPCRGWVTREGGSLVAKVRLNHRGISHVFNTDLTRSPLSE